VAADNKIGRFIADAVSSMPKLSPSSFDRLFNDRIQVPFPLIPLENGYYVLSANGWSYYLLRCRTTLRWSTCQASHGLRLRLPRSWTQLPKSCDFHALSEWPTSCCLCLIFVCLNEESEYAFLYLLSKFWKKRIHHVWDPNVCTNGLRPFRQISIVVLCF
jgi:hypothetical protein